MVQLNMVDMELIYFHHDNLVTNRVRDISIRDLFLISKNINAIKIKTENTIAPKFVYTFSKS
jgi:hypothetical protein